MPYGLPNDPVMIIALVVARVTLGVALVHRQTAAERDRGQKLLAEVSEVFLRRGHNLGDLPIVKCTWRVRGLGVEIAMRPYRSCAPPSTIWSARDNCWSWGVPATGVLVETLLDRGADGDVVEAEAAIERLAAAPADEGLVMRDIWLLRLRALLARAHGDARLQRISGIATATWRKRLASKGISPGPRRCHDAGHPGRAAHIVSNQTETHGMDVPVRCVSKVCLKKKPSQYRDTALMRHTFRNECTEANFGARIRYSDNVSGLLPTSTVVVRCLKRYIAREVFHAVQRPPTSAKTVAATRGFGMRPVNGSTVGWSTAVCSSLMTVRRRYSLPPRR